MSERGSQSSPRSRFQGFEFPADADALTRAGLSHQARRRQSGYLGPTGAPLNLAAAR